MTSLLCLLLNVYVNGVHYRKEGGSGQDELFTLRPPPLPSSAVFVVNQICLVVEPPALAAPVCVTASGVGFDADGASRPSPALHRVLSAAANPEERVVRLDWMVSVKSPRVRLFSLDKKQLTSAKINLARVSGCCVLIGQLVLKRRKFIVRLYWDKRVLHSKS